ncbi:UPF0236 family protein [Shewanella sp. VB17]|uniref:UPF0236 family transposase-like protein n=1 Tax=Shewanella sp. VB17 TaxID=2739432 RepID=UPI001562FFA8|nr:UPF0236 family protein [Shewanella sp. VB17]NRD71808.1 UPF0236 family protein [Shewanella sp. VB17]
MNLSVRVIVETINEAGEVKSHSIINIKPVIPPSSLAALGYRQAEQIEMLQYIQQALLDEQSYFLQEDTPKCPRCNNKITRNGYVKSNFHGVYTDHKVSTRKQICLKCKWKSIPSIDSLFGCAIHPDLARVQTEMGAKYSYRDAEHVLALLSSKKRSINNHERIKKTTECIGEYLSLLSRNDNIIQPQVADNLCIQVDGGYVNTVEADKNCFEVMTAVIFDPELIDYGGGKLKRNGPVSSLRGRLISKHSAASALADQQSYLKQTALESAIKQGMTKDTSITAICGGTDNCWNVIDAIAPHCHDVTRILDWFDIVMKFENLSLKNKRLREKAKRAKWHLWRGYPDRAIIRLEEIKNNLNEKNDLQNITKLLSYINNNLGYIIDYRQRHKNGLIFTSQLSESTVESLINQRCHRQQHMRWSRKGLHFLLQVRASISTNNSWQEHWECYVSKAMSKTAA